MTAAFDMGIRNFAFAVKYNGEFILLKNTCLNEDILTKADLNKLKKNNLVEMMSNLNIKYDENIKKQDIVNLIFSNKKIKDQNKPKDLGMAMFKIMDEYKDYWNKCETFLIERQMATNLQALKLSHYLEAYLKIHYPEKKILNYNASTKTKKLGAINLKDKKDRKRWTVEYVSNLLTGDNLRYFTNLTKQDDVADVICMIESF